MKAAVVTHDHQVDVTENTASPATWRGVVENGVLWRMPYRPAREKRRFWR